MDPTQGSTDLYHGVKCKAASSRKGKAELLPDKLREKRWYHMASLVYGATEVDLTQGFIDLYQLQSSVCWKQAELGDLSLNKLKDKRWHHMTASVGGTTKCKSCIILYHLVEYKVDLMSLKIPGILAI